MRWGFWRSPCSGSDSALESELEVVSLALGRQHLPTSTLAGRAGTQQPLDPVVGQLPLPGNLSWPRNAEHLANSRTHGALLLTPTSTQQHALQSLMDSEEPQSIQREHALQKRLPPSSPSLRSSNERLSSDWAGSSSTMMRHSLEYDESSALPIVQQVSSRLGTLREEGGDFERSSDSMSVACSSASPDADTMPAAIRSDPLNRSALYLLAQPVRNAISEAGPASALSSASLQLESAEARAADAERDALSGKHASLSKTEQQLWDRRILTRQRPGIQPGAASAVTHQQPDRGHMIWRGQLAKPQHPWGPGNQAQWADTAALFADDEAQQEDEHQQREDEQPPESTPSPHEAEQARTQHASPHASPGIQHEEGASRPQPVSGMHQEQEENQSSDSDLTDPEVLVSRQEVPSAQARSRQRPRSRHAAQKRAPLPHFGPDTRQLLTSMCYNPTTGAGQQVPRKLEGLLQGHFAAQSMAGIGTFVTQTGTCYEGQWKESAPHGFGILVRARHATHVGSFRDGLLHGPGLTRTNDGTTYAGEIEHGLRHGHGVLQLADGSHYIGSFQQGMRNGLGMFSFAIGDCYWGCWDADNMQGLGVYQHEAGSIYEGMWSLGCRHGWGVLTSHEGNMHAGLWQRGKMRWQRPLLPGAAPELEDLTSEAVDLAQETARSARSLARTVAALQRSLRDPNAALQVGLRKVVSQARKSAAAARTATRLTSEAAHGLRPAVRQAQE